MAIASTLTRLDEWLQKHPDAVIKIIKSEGVLAVRLQDYLNDKPGRYVTAHKADSMSDSKHDVYISIPSDVDAYVVLLEAALSKWWEVYP